MEHRLRNALFGAAAVVCIAGAAWALFSSPPVNAKSDAPTPVASPKEPALMRIARTTNIAVDGDFDDPGWTKGAKTGPFVDDLGAPARPFTDARVAWGDGMLYVGFYSADENIVTNSERADGPLWLADDVHLALTVGDHEYAIDASPSGTITDGVRINGGAVDYSWSSEAHVGKEMDGTLNDPSDNDEEWLIELAIPLKNLGLEGKAGDSIGVRMRRCDTTKSGQKSCASAEPTRIELL
jgi:hypothetical protein